MTRRDLLEAVRARGLDAQPHHVDRAIQAGRLRPAPARVGDRIVYGAAHVDQLADLVRAIRARRLQRREVPA